MSKSQNKAIRMGKGVRVTRGNQGDNGKFQANDSWV